MESKHIEKFNEAFVARDHTEALLINDEFDHFRGNPATQETPLAAAIAAVHAALEDTASPIYQDNPELHIAHAAKYGYLIAQRASRWFNYRAAYLDDLAETYAALDLQANGDPWKFGLEPSYTSYAEKLEGRFYEQRSADEGLANGENAYVYLFAALGQERLRRQTHDEMMLDPLALERQFALRALMNAMDDLVEGPGGSGIEDEHMYGGKLPYIEGMDFVVRRNNTENGLAYCLDLFEADEDSIIDDDSGDRWPTISYKLLENDQGISEGVESMQGPTEPDTAGIIQMVTNLLNDTNYNFVRAVNNPAI